MTMKRMPELDSLRAIAAVIVLFFHLDPLRYFPGWSGVDLFFVLSGYLITSIILKNAGTRGFFPNFYARRSLRIWPIYYLVLFGLIAINPYLRKPVFLKEMPYALTYTRDLPFYWGARPLLQHPATDHAWTLSIEEQFYLIWPALVIWAGRKRLVPLCLLTISIALATRDGNNWFLPKYPERLLLSRCDGFALGGLLAGLLSEKGWARRRPILGALTFGTAIGLALIYLAWGSWAFGTLIFIGLPTPRHPAETIFMFGVLYAGMIGLVALRSGDWWLWPLRFRPIVYLGQISYGLYLYHYVVYWMIDGFDPKVSVRTGQPWPIQAGKLGTALLVAVVSWHLIEKPILSLKDRFRYREAPSLEPPPTDPVSTG